METICEKQECTACGACMNVCPKNAIQMVEDGAAGYLYPHIDADLCIDCGLCVKTCPANHPVGLHQPEKAYAAICKDVHDLMSSTSGGASSLLAAEILHRGGTVFGCAQESYKDIRHIRIEKSEDAWKIKESKYVQSSIGFIYRDVKSDLQTGREVLFIGTPCQVAGLKRYLRKDYENLLLVDLVCHGVPSQKLLKENVERILRDNHLTDGQYRVAFRRKGRQTSDLRYGVFLTEDAIPVPLEKKSVIFPTNDYIAAFMAGLIFRDNCYTCPYARPRRCSDITIADFWGLQKCSVPNGRGVSLLLVSTKRGESMVQAIREKAVIEERPVEEAVHGNGQLQKPSVCPAEREFFLAQYATAPARAYKESLKHYRYMQKRKKAIATILKIPFSRTLYRVAKSILRRNK